MLEVPYLIHTHRRKPDTLKYDSPEDLSSDYHPKIQRSMIKRFQILKFLILVVLLYYARGVLRTKYAYNPIRFAGNNNCPILRSDDLPSQHG